MNRVRADVRRVELDRVSPARREQTRRPGSTQLYFLFRGPAGASGQFLALRPAELIQSRQEGGGVALVLARERRANTPPQAQEDRQHDEAGRQRSWH